MKKILLLLTTFISVIAFAQDGALDLSYNPVLSTNMQIERILIQSDGKSLIQEKLTAIPYQTRIIRLTENGTVDPSFTCALGVDKPLGLGGIQPDGKILIIQNNVQQNTALLYRLHPNGSIDATFKTLTGADGLINSGVLQPDGKIIVAGMFSNYNGSVANKIIRLEADGERDSSFQYANPTYRITSVKLLSDGKLLLLCQYAPDISGHLVKLNSTGSYDSNFTITESCNMYHFTLQSNEKIINQESCTDWSMTTPPYEILYRLNNNGTSDSSFVRLGFDAPGPVAFWVLNDDSIIVTGFFSSYGGATANNIVKLQPDGQINAVFNGGSGPNDEVWDIAQQQDGKLILVGLFTSYNGTSRDNIARLFNTNLGVHDFDLGSKLKVYPNPATTFIQLEMGEGITATDFEIYDVNSRKVKTQQSADNTINISNLEQGVYFLKVRTDNGVVATKFIKN